MNTIAFFGGSIPAGGGYADEKASEFIYPNLIANKGYTIFNCSKPGSGNHEIFLSCCNFLANDHADILIIEWNTFHRFWFYPKFNFELFISASGFSVNEKLKSILGLSVSELKKIQKYLLTLNGEYKSLINLLDYCFILQDYAKLKNIQIIMINGNTPWTDKVFQNPENIKNIFLETDDFTKNLLDSENLDDEEVIHWWIAIYQKYKKINLENWVCFSEKLLNYQVDYAPLDNHPGPQSHKIFAEKILYQIEREL